MRVTKLEAIALLKRGKVVALPTETVYGLAAIVTDKAAIEEIYKIKGRPPLKPLTICLSDLSQAEYFGRNIPQSFYELGKKYWPGPLTLIIPAQIHNSAEIIRASQDTIGLRIPNDPATLQVIEGVGPIVLPSANRSGEAPLNTAEEIEAVFGKDFPICEGKQGSGISSTVLEWRDGEWVTLRQGEISDVSRLFNTI